MNDELKTKIQLIAELTALRKQVVEFKESEGTQPEDRDESKQANDTYRVLLKNIPAIVFRMHLRKNMNMSFFNDMVKALTGYTTEEITRDNVCSLYHLVLKEDREEVLATIEQALIKCQPFQVEYRLRHKDGSLRHFTEKGTPIFGEDRKPLYIDGIIVDNTEYRLTDEALRETQEKFRSLVESIDDWIWEVDAEGNYTYVSPQVSHVLGYDAASLFGKTLFDLIVPEDADRMRRLFQENLAAGKPLPSTEKSCLHKDGRTRILETSGSPFLNAEGNVLGYRGRDRDVTQQKHVERQGKLKCDILDCLNEADGLPKMIQPMIDLMTGEERFDAAAIRIRSTDASSSYYAAGLADPFLALEKTQESIDGTQRLMQPDSRPSLEYLYGCILRGQIDPAFSSTADGISFWINRLSETPDLFEPADHPSPLRDAFQEQGYESLALVPILAEQEVLGLLQIMDRRRDLFDGETVSILEKTGRAIGQVWKKDRTARDILAAKNRYEGRLNIVRDWIWETNQELVLTYVGRQVQPLLGYGAAELFNQNILEIMPAEENDHIEDFIREQTPQDDPAVRKAVFKSKDGNLVHLDMSVVPLLEEGGSGKGFRGICREPATGEPEADHTFLAMIEDNPAGVYISQEGVFTFLNPKATEIAGYEKDDLIGKNTMHLVYPDDRFSLSDHLRRMLHGTENSPCEFRIAKPNGSLVWLMQAVRSVSYEEKPAVLGIFMDITSFKEREMQQRLSYQKEALGMMSAGLIREIDNILAFVNGYTEIAQAEPAAASLHQPLEQIAMSCSRGWNLLEKINTISGHGHYEKGAVDLNGLIRKVMEEMGKTWPTSIEIRPSIPAESFFVLADPEQVRQILTHLCANAAYAMRNKGGILEVRADHTIIEQPETFSAVRLTVSDTGQGIDPEDIDHIFDPFWTTKTPGEGSGLGLPLVHALVKDLGGVLRMTSKPGTGTTFTVDLPLIDPSQVQDIPPAEVIPHGAEKVLLIEDNEDVAHLGGSILKSLGYQTVTTTDAAKALGMIGEEALPFDLAIIDMTMPDINGMNIARKITEIHPGFPMILCKGKTEIIAEAEAKRAGIRDFLAKPLSRKPLAHCVRKVLDEVKSDVTPERTEL